MRQFILLRHAKSSWANPDLPDLDRALNKRGKRAARALGAWLGAEGWLPDEVLCSPARRTRETWEGLGLPGTPVLRPELYEATAGTILATLQAARGQRVLLIGHNPGIAELAQMMVAPPDHPRFGDFPTGSLLMASADIGDWADLAPGMARLERFITPHDLVSEPDA